LSTLITERTTLPKYRVRNALSQELYLMQQQLASPPVQLTFPMLREAKRYVQFIKRIPSFVAISKFLVNVDDGICLFFLTYYNIVFFLSFGEKIGSLSFLITLSLISEGALFHAMTSAHSFQMA
jgi:hypothetical protein